MEPSPVDRNHPRSPKTGINTPTPVKPRSPAPPKRSRSSLPASPRLRSPRAVSQPKTPVTRSSQKAAAAVTEPTVIGETQLEKSPESSQLSASLLESLASEEGVLDTSIADLVKTRRRQCSANPTPVARHRPLKLKGKTP